MVLGPYIKIKKNMTQIHEHICLELIFYPSTLFDTSTYTCLSIVHLRICTKYCICNCIYEYRGMYGGVQLWSIGDRVLVSGTKTGTLKYIGATDFAKGDWAGVELDEKQGKNDGAVSGKRCKEKTQPNYLFKQLQYESKQSNKTVLGFLLRKEWLWYF